MRSSSKQAAADVQRESKPITEVTKTKDHDTKKGK